MLYKRLMPFCRNSLVSIFWFLLSNLIKSYNKLACRALWPQIYSHIGYNVMVQINISFRLHLLLSLKKKKKKKKVVLQLLESLWRVYNALTAVVNKLLLTCISQKGNGSHKPASKLIVLVYFRLYEAEWSLEEWTHECCSIYNGKKDVYSIFHVPYFIRF